MSQQSKYFYEDAVYRITKKGNVEFGMVLCSSELLLSDDSENEDNQRDKLKKDQIRVAWHPSGKEEVVFEKRVGLADRSLMPGDVVRRLIKGKDTQRGYCRNMKVTACLRILGSNKIISNVPSNQLSTPLQEFTPDCAVCLDSWVGAIKNVKKNIIIRLPDNTQMVVNRDRDGSGFDVFVPNTSSGLSRLGDYYPGQILYGPFDALSSYIDLQTKFPKKFKKKKNIKVVVESVETESIEVFWQLKAYKSGDCANNTVTDITVDQPKSVIMGKDIARLKLLNVFDPCTLQVADRNLYIIRDNDQIITKDQWRKQQKELYCKKKPKKNNSVNDEKLNNMENKYCTCETNDEVDNQNINESDWLTEDSLSNGTSSTQNNQIINKSRQPSLSISVSKPWTKTFLKRRQINLKKKNNHNAISVLPGSKVIVETISTQSVADVVWQDGTVEKGIPSVELYPIHHLDDQEFFPGDFVIENMDHPCMRVYGVIQSVDHIGRTAKVKWFRTYTCSETPSDLPCPTYLAMNETSVYDLKDHPDFQYRPGTVVIRVANFEGPDENCTAGQVLDNDPEGKVLVWWVDGHESMCWPQDLYKLNDHDDDDENEFLWGDESSADELDDDSWLTESEIDPPTDPITNDDDLKPKLAANIEKARVAMARLEVIFTQNPSLQTTDVMKKLLEVYKDCRYLDKLMGTSYFDEDNFDGLIGKVREKGRISTAQKVQQQINRLFNENKGNDDENIVNYVKVEENLTDILINKAKSEIDANLDILQNESTESSKLLNGTNIPSSSKKVENLSENENNSKKNLNNHVCIRLCSLILTQLIKANSEVKKRFGVSLPENVRKLSPKLSNFTEDEINSGTLSSKTSLDTITNVTSQMSDSDYSKSGDNITELLNDNMVTAIVKEDSVQSIDAVIKGSFSILDQQTPNTHTYKLTICQPINAHQFCKAVKNEIKLMRTSLPAGIWVKGFEDRMDIFSVMILGPENTPYEDGLFFFDIHLPSDYPTTPPHFHYLSYCSDRLNPNLYEDGKVCVSLLGTWSGKGTEIWTSQSNLLQVLVSIQGLILVPEPYFNEAGYEKQKGTQQGHENSRMYNEMAILKLVQSMTKVLQHPPPVFKEEILHHFHQHAEKFYNRLQNWAALSKKFQHKNDLYLSNKDAQDEIAKPEFQLIPASKGFCLTLNTYLELFKKMLQQNQITIN